MQQSPRSRPALLRQSTRSATWTLTGKLDRDPPVYFPGDSIILSLTLDIHTGKGMIYVFGDFLKLEGLKGKILMAVLRRQEATKWNGIWSQKGGGTVTTNLESHQFLREGTRPFHLEDGVYHYQHTFTVPRNARPTWFHRGGGFITDTEVETWIENFILVHFERPKSGKRTSLVHFLVGQVFSPDLWLTASRPKTVEVSHTFAGAGGQKVAAKPIKITISLERYAYHPGENIKVALCVANDSSKTISGLNLSLKQRIFVLGDVVNAGGDRIETELEATAWKSSVDYFLGPGQAKTSWHTVQVPDQRISMLTLPERSTGLFRFLHAVHLHFSVMWSAPIKVFININVMPSPPPADAKIVARNLENAQQVVYVVPAPEGPSATLTASRVAALPPVFEKLDTSPEAMFAPCTFCGHVCTSKEDFYEHIAMKHPSPLVLESQPESELGASQSAIAAPPPQEESDDSDDSDTEPAAAASAPSASHSLASSVSAVSPLRLPSSGKRAPASPTQTAPLQQTVAHFRLRAASDAGLAAASGSSPSLGATMPSSRPVLQRSLASLKLNSRLNYNIADAPVRTHTRPAAAHPPARPLKATLRRTTHAPESGGFLVGTVVPSGIWLGTARGLVFRCNHQGEELSSFAAHKGRIYGIVPAWPFVWTCGDDGQVNLWDAMAPSAPRLKLTLTAHGRHGVRALASVYLPSEGYVVCSGDANGTVCIWPMTPGEEIEPITRLSTPLQEPLQNIAQTTDMLWVGCRRNIYLYDLTTLNHTKTLSVPQGVNRLLVVPGGGMWCATNTSILVFAPDGTQLRSLEGHSGRVYSLYCSPIFSVVFSGSFDKQLLIWDMQSGEKLAALAGQHKDGVRVILECVSATEAILISAGDTEDMSITSWLISRDTK